MHYSLVGNHDASTSSLIFNSVNSFLSSNHKVVTEPSVLPLSDCFICFLPYVVECDRRPLGEYFSKLKEANVPVIILSHNDISGIQLGPVVSRTGFSLEEIEANCDLFLNGHLHNGQAISPKVINLGNLTGKDFGEDASKYSHNIAILDTKTLQLTYIENPYAYNFYKIQIDTEYDLKLLDNLKPQAVVSIKCDSTLVEKVKQRLIELKNIIVESRIILVKKFEESSEAAAELDLSVDHLARFVECCKATIEYTPLLEEEIGQICK
jgi:DNA repair exonuclease SbcCD nuclease subunit